jgi:diguanylate cyclase (GGDEF)-like protein
MRYEELLHFLYHVGTDPSRLIFEDDLTGIYNRRFLLNYFRYKVSWEALKDHPVSLIMMDVDNFKQINDHYGHDAGDRALIWVAGLIKEASGEKGLPVRYAGDEFIIFLPYGDRDAALQVGERLLKRIQQEPFWVRERSGGLHITLSIGISSAPEDAQSGKDLIQKADTALYYAKKVGRNRLANAAEIPPQEVSSKTALYHLEREQLAGRRTQLSEVAKSYQVFSRGQSQFLLIEGPTGMGKTAFLEMIHSKLPSNKRIEQVRVSGTPQERDRPYYLTTHILVSLMHQRTDKGIGVIKSLGTREMAYLARVLPQVGGKEEPFLEEDEGKEREGVFNTLIYFIPKLLEFNRLILLVDDLHFADEATLLLLRQFMIHPNFSIFICATSTPIEQLNAKGVPLVRFYETYHRALSLQRINLTPLTASDIADYLRDIFSQISWPQDFDKELAQMTQGNPLFLGEILRKLVLDQKIPLRGHHWVIEPPGKGYFPKSLEEMVSQKIAALDEEGRQLLFQAAAFGEDLSLSLLAGSSEKVEAKIVEFVDQAVAQGLLRTDFGLNDERIRFLSKRILETIYEAIQPDWRQKLHERIGRYQEMLYQRHLLPSAVTLVYHFKRSANLEKVRAYEKSEEFYDHRIFDASEAATYTGERRKRRRELPPPGIPLDAAGFAQVPNVIRCLVTAVRNIKLYPDGSEPVVSANRQFRETVDAILETNENLTIFQVKQTLMVNGQKIDVTEFRLVAEDLLKLMAALDISGVIFHRGLTEREVDILVEAFGREKPKMIDRNFWQHFSTDQHLAHIELKQVQYTLTVEAVDPAVEKGKAGKADIAIPVKVSYHLRSGEPKLDREDMSRIPDILRCLLSAAKNIKLYPLDSKTLSISIDQFLETLRKILTKRPVLTLAQVGNALLVNGEKLDPSEMEGVVSAFLKFLDSITLRSLTFLDTITTGQTKIFFEALGQLPTHGMSSDFWTRLAQNQRLSTILFDQILYETRVAPALTGYTREQLLEETSEEFWEVKMTEPIAEELLDSFFKEVPIRMNDLFLRGDEKQILQMIRRLFQGFQNRPFPMRERIIESCRWLLEGQTLPYQHHYSRLLAHPLIIAFSEEKDPKMLREIASLLRHMATHLIEFADYPLATRIFLNLSKRHQKLLSIKDPDAQRLAKVFDTNLEGATQKLLAKDLKLNEPARQQHVAQLLSSLGSASIPFLVDIIKKEEDLRIRLVAARVLGELGPEAAELLKREIILESTTEERLRILEVIDTVTHDLKSELVFAIRDETPGIRQAGFRLAERLNNSETIELLLDYVWNQKAELAVDGIKCLGRLKAVQAVEILVSLLGGTNHKKLLIACCQALGQIGDPAAVEALAKIVNRKGSLFRRQRRTPQVRATAAFALTQISDPRVIEVLAPFVKDRNPRVREIARRVLGALDSPSALSST